MIRLPAAVTFLAVLLATASPARAAREICPGSPVPPGGEACRFTLWSSQGCAIQLAPGSADCLGLERISSAFVELRNAAGFGDEQLGHLCGTIDWPETPLASYTAWNHCVYVNWAFLRTHGSDDDATRFAMAHEIGHGVQDRRGDMAWAAAVAGDESPAGVNEFHRRRRILEAQADTLAIQLLERTGRPKDAARRGFVSINSCSAVSADEVDAGTSTHPAARTRWLNMTAAAPLIETSARKSLGSGGTEGLSRLFDGGSGRAVELDAVTGAPPIPVLAPLAPAFPRGDFNDQGAIRLKRAAVEHFRPDPPYRWSGPVRKLVFAASLAIADAAGEAIDRFWGSRRVSDLAVSSCESRPSPR